MFFLRYLEPVSRLVSVTSQSTPSYYILLKDAQITSFFSLILTPKIIVYDNACNLHSYCLNRNPTCFKETKFLVDRFHWKNHRGKVFGIDLHPCMHASV
jgi:hypothetical protein